MRKILYRFKRKIFKIIIKFLDLQKPKIENWSSKTALRSSFYYFVFNDSFRRQQQSVLLGKLAYEKRGEKNLIKLIRNIHRIEKGLIMPKLKPIYAKGYILETIEVYVSFYKDNLQSKTFEWATDVLLKFYSVVDLNDPIVKKSYQLFIQTQNSEILKNGEKTPYLREDNIKSSINFEDFNKLARQRRSIRWYKKDRVERSKLELAFQAALQSPSACNRQPFRFVVLDREDLKNEVGQIPMGATSFYENVPMFVIIIGDLSSYFDERDRNLIYLDGGLISMSFMLALETLGLSSCPINWPDIEVKERLLNEGLALKPYERCIMFMAVGYADEQGKIPYSQKKEVKEIISYNK